MVTHILHTITDAASSRWGKFVTMALWLVAVGVLAVAAPKLADVYDNTQQQVPTGNDSQVAARLLLKEFPSSRGTPAIIVFTDANGLSADDTARAKRVNDWLTSARKPAGVGNIVSIFTVPQAASQLISKDGTTMTMVVGLPDSSGDTTTPAAVKAIRAYLSDTTRDSSLHAYATGPAGIIADSIAVFSSADVKLLLATVALVLVLLLVVYRSPILALLPLVAVGLVLQVANSLLALATKGGLFPVSQQAGSIATVLLFGAGTDYSIFIASRFREELRRTQDKHAAMRAAMRAVGEAITSSAGTVILALATLLLATLSLYSSLGPTMAATIVVMLVAGLTLVPALLVWLGRAAYWPFVPRYQPDQALETDATVARRGIWGRLGAWAAASRRRQVIAVAGSTLLLGVLALGNLGIARSYNFLTSFRVATDSTTGYNVLQLHFPAGSLAPTTVLIQLHGTEADAYTHLAQLDAVTAAVGQVKGVAKAQGPTRPGGTTPTIDLATLQTAIAALPAQLKAAIRSGDASAIPAPCTGPACPPVDPQLAAAIGAYAASIQFVSSDGTTVQLSVTFDDDPYALPAIERIAQVRDAVNQALRANNLGSDAATTAEVHIAGQTSLLADTKAADARDTRLIVPAVLLLVGIVLALLLRSLIAPLYLLAAVTLNFFAAIGVCSFVFQRVQGQDGIFYAIPLYTFIFLVALGADYTIFLMSRVREEAARHGLQAGVPLAVASTGGVITSAGLILAGTFAVLTTLPLTLLYQFGVCVAVGILLDTFVVRGLLVPGLVLLLGRWNWWPGAPRIAATLAVGTTQPDNQQASAQTNARSGLTLPDINVERALTCSGCSLAQAPKARLTARPERMAACGGLVSANPADRTRRQAEDNPCHVV